MTDWLLYACSGAALVGLGIHGLLLRRHLVRRVLGLNVLGNGVFALLLALGSRGAGPSDPIPQAIVITGIVVAVAATALALAITVRYYAATGRITIDTPSDPLAQMSDHR